MALTYAVNHSTLKTSLVSWHPLNELSDGSGQVDRSDAHSTWDLTDNGTTPSITGPYNRAADFTPGNSEYMDSSTSYGADIGSSVTTFSCAFWFKADVKGDNDGVVYIGNFASSQGEFSVSIGNTDLVTAFDGAVETGLVSNSKILTDGTWQHYAMSYNGTDYTVWLDGTKEVDASSYSTTLNFTGLKLVLGGYYSSSFLYDGGLKDVAVWNKALSDAEAADLYNSGDGMTYGIDFDNATEGVYSASTTSHTTSHTVGTGDNRFLVVQVLGGAAGDATTDVTGMTYGGVSMTKSLAHSGATTGNTPFDLYTLAAPATGANDVVVSISPAGKCDVMIHSYFGVDQTTPVPTTSNGQDTSLDSDHIASITTTIDYSWALDFVREDWGRTITAGAGYTLRTESGGMHGADSGGAIATAGSHTFNGTWSGNCKDDWGLLEIAVAPAAAASTFTPKVMMY